MAIIGFLSPNGEFVECKELEHSAKRICEENNIETNNFERELANRGWCFFQKNYAGIPADIKPLPFITDEQVDWIIKNYENINRKQRYFISEKLKHDEIYKKRTLPDGIDSVPFSGLL